jgi:hypothetical protein
VAKAPGNDLPLGAGTRTAKSKFLEVVKGAAEANYLELVVDPDGPNSGYAHVQKHDSFTNLYAFHFEFGDSSAVFYLGTESGDALNSEQRQQVEYKDGERMELVLKEIRSKIHAAAEKGFPTLTSLSSAKSQPAGDQTKTAPAPRATSSNSGGATVWGQDELSMARDRYRYKKPPGKSYTGVILSAVLVVALVFAFAPVLGTNGAISGCHAAACQTSTAYYKSASFNFLGVGGVYIPQSSGWGTFGRGTLQAGNGTLMGGISLRQFYVVW